MTVRPTCENCSRVTVVHRFVNDCVICRRVTKVLLTALGRRQFLPLSPLDTPLHQSGSVQFFSATLHNNLRVDKTLTNRSTVGCESSFTPSTFAIAVVAQKLQDGPRKVVTADVVMATNYRGRRQIFLPTRQTRLEA